jgi:predicted outer membrane repeat protein
MSDCTFNNNSANEGGAFYVNSQSYAISDSLIANCTFTSNTAGWIGGAAGYSYEIQYTMDLTVTNAWVTLTNLTLDQPNELWVDTTTNAATTQRRYYRILPGQ